MRPWLQRNQSGVIYAAGGPQSGHIDKKEFLDPCLDLYVSLFYPLSAPTEAQAVGSSCQD
jgi:hypothetical protein